MKNYLLILIAVFFCLSACEKESGSDLQAKAEEELTAMYINIQQTVDTVVCDDPSQWSISALGKDMYGAVKEYIAYPHSIDTSNFLKLVENYTQTEIEYNKKYHPTTAVVLSTPPPTQVDCIEGKATLVYDNED